MIDVIDLRTVYAPLSRKPEFSTATKSYKPSCATSTPRLSYQSDFQYHIFPHRLHFGLLAFATKQKELDHATIRPKLRQHLASGPRDDVR